MSSIPDVNFEKHFSDIDESDEDDDVGFFGDDIDEEEDEVNKEEEDKVEKLPGMRDAYENLVLEKYGNHRETALIKYKDEYQELLRKAEAIARNRIAANTRSQYNKANIIFVHWLYFFRQTCSEARIH